MEKGARWSAGDEEPEAVAALEGVDGEDLDVDADDGVESLTGSLGHLRSVSLTTIVVMLAHPLSSSSELFFFSKRRRRLRSGTRAPEEGRHTHTSLVNFAQHQPHHFLFLTEIKLTRTTLSGEGPSQLLAKRTHGILRGRRRKKPPTDRPTG